jgi:hypothetical protein
MTEAELERAILRLTKNKSVRYDELLHALGPLAERYTETQWRAMADKAGVTVAEFCRAIAVADHYRKGGPRR